MCGIERGQNLGSGSINKNVKKYNKKKTFFLTPIFFFAGNPFKFWSWIPGPLVPPPCKYQNLKCQKNIFDFLGNFHLCFPTPNFALFPSRTLRNPHKIAIEPRPRIYEFSASPQTPPGGSGRKGGLAGVSEEKF